MECRYQTKYRLPIAMDWHVRGCMFLHFSRFVNCNVSKASIVLSLAGWLRILEIDLFCSANIFLRFGVDRLCVCGVAFSASCDFSSVSSPFSSYSAENNVKNTSLVFHCMALNEIVPSMWNITDSLLIKNHYMFLF